MRKFRPKQCPKCKYSPTRNLCYPPDMGLYVVPRILDHNHTTKRKCPDFKPKEGIALHHFPR